MHALNHEMLYQHALSGKLKGKVVLITGAGSGIGREVAIKAASFGAKLAISDISISGCQSLVEKIEKAGGEAHFSGSSCDVTIWEEQLAFFQSTMGRYGTIDLVLVNAGVSELGGRPFDVDKVIQTAQGPAPAQPAIKAIQVNVIGAIYTCKLAFYYLQHGDTGKNKKGIILMGSMAGIIALPLSPLYTASKHAVLALMRSLYFQAAPTSIIISAVAPWFVRTPILPAPFLVMMSGIPLTPIEDVVAACICALSSSEESDRGLTYTVPDDKGVWAIEWSEWEMGVGMYEILRSRLTTIINLKASLKFRVKQWNDVWYVITGGLSRQILMFVLGALILAGANGLWTTFARNGTLT